LEQIKKIIGRSEGDLKPANEVGYAGLLGIVNKPAFRTSIRSKKCLVIYCSYIEGPEKERLNKPFPIRKKYKVKWV
jgi:putative SOS response-associated peptidase YedK